MFQDVLCDNCHRQIFNNRDSFTCRYCHKISCNNCRLPKSHNCRRTKNNFRHKHFNESYSNRMRRCGKKKIVLISVVLFLTVFILSIYDFENNTKYTRDDVIESSTAIIMTVQKESMELLDVVQNESAELIDVVQDSAMIPDSISEKLVEINNPIRDKSDFEAYIVEHYIYEFTNNERTVNGLQPLSKIPIIDSIARSHSKDMSDRNYFEHDTPEGLDPTDRGNLAGYDCTKDYGSYYTQGLGENIAQHWTYTSYIGSGVLTSYSWHESEEELAKDIVTGWMNSPGHRENILADTYDKIGIGVFISDSEEVYATQNFC